MLHDGLAARAGKAGDHIDPAKSELAKDPPRRRIVVSVSGPESQHPSVFARERHDGVRGLEGVAPPPLGAVEPIAQTSPVEVDNANDPSFEFNRETIGLPRLPLTRVVSEPSAKRTFVAWKRRHAKHARHLPIALNRKRPIGVRAERGPKEQTVGPQ
jgi:hypothetical protein